MFEDIRRHLSEVPEGEVIEESGEGAPSGSGPGLLRLLQPLTPSQRLVLLVLLLLDLFLLGFLVLLITGAIRLG